MRQNEHMNGQELHQTRRCGQRGMAVLAAILLIVFLAIASLVVDYGIMLVTRTELSKAVDAAALAGAQDLPDENSARSAATNYVAVNVPGTSDPVPTVTFPSLNVIRVQAAMPSPALFTRVLGLTDFTVGSVAVATRFDPNVAIIIDRSGSMCEDSYPSAALTGNCPAVGPWEPFSTVQQIAKDFVDEFSGDPVISLISFSTTARLDVALTSNRASVKTAIDNLRPGGYTDIAASFDQSIDELLRSTNQRPNVIVLLTDGKPNTVNGSYVGDTDPRPRQALTDSANTASSKGVVAHVITYGAQADNELMRGIAEQTEGKFYNAPNNSGLRTVYADIAAQSYIRLTDVH